MELKLTKTLKRFGVVTIYLLLYGFGFAAITDPEIQTRHPIGHLVGRSDYLALGGQVTLTAQSQHGVLVEWFRDGQPLGTTNGPDLELTSLTLQDTGNYHAVWMENERLVTSALFPLTVGPLPSSNFDSPLFTAGGARHPTTYAITQVLPDHRVATASSTWVGVGRSHTNYLYTADLTSSLKFNSFSDQWSHNALLGIDDDGTFFTRTSPYRFSTNGTPLPFNLPDEFAETPPSGVTSLGTDKILIHNFNTLVCTTPNGEIVYSRSATDLNYESISHVEGLDVDRVLIYGQISDITGQAVGRIAMLSMDGTLDPAFTAIKHLDSVRPIRLRDGTFSAISVDREVRHDAQGQKLPNRALPVSGFLNSFVVSPDGDLYGYTEGLGVVRWTGASREFDPHFFLPQELNSPTDLTRLAFRSDGKIVAFATDATKPIKLNPTLTLLETRTDSAPRLPVIGREVSIYGEDLYDAGPRYHSFPYNQNDIEPQAGAPLRLYCPVYTPGATQLEWIPLDGNLPPQTAADGALYIPSYNEHYAGRVQLVATNSVGRALGPIVDLRPRTQARLSNLSGRAYTAAGESNLIAGFVLRPRSDPHTQTDLSPSILVRGIGPTLTEFGITAPLPDPWIVLSEFDGSVIAQNDEWFNAPSLSYGILQRLGAFTPPLDSLDASIYQSLSEGVYTATTLAKAEDKGIALTEIYIDDPAPTSREQLVNLSLRTNAGEAENALVAGFVIEDPDNLARSARILIRAVGPTLTNYDVNNPLADPQLTLHRHGTELASNDNWATSEHATELAAAATQVGAFPLPSDSADAALMVDLPPGNYTATVTPTGTSAPGEVLLELYLLTED